MIYAGTRAHKNQQIALQEGKLKYVSKRFLVRGFPACVGIVALESYRIYTMGLTLSDRDGLSSYFNQYGFYSLATILGGWVVGGILIAKSEWSSLTSPKSSKAN